MTIYVITLLEIKIKNMTATHKKCLADAEKLPAFLYVDHIS